MAEQIVFYVLGGLTVLGALAVIVPPFARNPLHAAVALLATFSLLAGLFVMLSAHLLAVLQILVYAGAVMVLFIFVIMLLNLRREDLGGFRVTSWKILGGVADFVAGQGQAVRLLEDASALGLQVAVQTDLASQSLCSGDLAAMDVQRGQQRIRNGAGRLLARGVKVGPPRVLLLQIPLVGLGQSGEAGG